MTIWSGSQPFFIILTSIQLLSQLIFSYLFFQKRHHRIAKARLPWLSILCSLSICHIALILELNAIWPELPCGFNMYTNICAIGFCINTFLLRFWLLIVNLNLEVEKIGGKGGWFFKFSFTQSPRFLIKMFLLLCLCIFIPFFVLAIIDPQSLSDEHCTNSIKKTVEVIGVIYIAAFVFACGGLVYLIKGKKESFFIKAELVRISLLGVVGILSYFILRFISAIGDFNNEVFSITTLFFSCCAILIQYIMLIYPIHMISKVVNMRRQKSLVTMDIYTEGIEFTFKELLTHSEFIIAFRDFLASEWCVENILFLEAEALLEAKVKAFLASQQQKAEHPKSRVALVPSVDLKYTSVDNSASFPEVVDEIMDKFFTPNGLLEINVSANCSDAIKEEISSILNDANNDTFSYAKLLSQRHVFEPARRDISHMLEHGPFERFQFLPEFDYLLKKICKENMNRNSSKPDSIELQLIP